MLPIYAPYTSLIQSSGYGKSKLTDEILKLKPGVSLVFRNQSERGYPIQTEWVKDFEQFIYGATLDGLPLNVADWHNLKAIEYSSGRVLLGILIILKAYISWFWKLRLSGLSREESIQFIGKHFISSSSKWGDQNNTLTFNEGSFCSEFTIDKTVTWISALSANRTTDIRDFSHNFGFPRKAVEELFPEYENFPFLFFFDEISNFDRKAPLGRLPGIHVLQRAFHALKTIPKIMAIAIGTAIDAWNFYPAVRDKSLRYLDRKNLLPPIWLTCNWDIFFDELELYKVEVDVDFLLNRNVMKLMLAFGRPLWASVIIESALSIAQSKLENGKSESMEALMSYLLCRADMNINENSALARTLVRSHMATVSFIDSDARRMKISYPSEPILAIASAALLKGRKEYRKKCFAALSIYLQRQILDRGRLVETIHEHFLLFAIDDAEPTNVKLSLDNSKQSGYLKKILDSKNILLDLNSQTAVSELPVKMEVDFEAPAQPPEIAVKTEYYHIIRVSDYLKSLLKPEHFDMIKSLIPKEDSPIMNAYMNSTHFINLQNDNSSFLSKLHGQSKAEKFIITRSILNYGLLRRCAFVMPPNQISVLFDEKGAPGKRSIYSFIGIQSKASMGYYNEEIARTEMSLHVKKCSGVGSCTAEKCNLGLDCISDVEFEKMVQNQLVIFMCFDSHDLFKSESNTLKISTRTASLFGKRKTTENVDVEEGLSELNFSKEEQMEKNKIIMQESFEVAKSLWSPELLINSTWENVVFQRGFGKLEETKRPDSVLKYSFEPIVKDSNRLYNDFSLTKMTWKGTPKFLTCLMIHDIKQLTHLTDESAIDILRRTVNQEMSSFDDIPDFHQELVINSAINGGVSGFHQFDPHIRAAKGLPSLPSTLEKLTNYNDVNLKHSITKCIERSSGDG